MDECIERERLLRKFNIDDMMNVNGTLISLREVRETISNFPAADVVTVVRCKDCKHYAPEIEYCGIHSHFVTRNGDFCYPDESSEWKTFSQEDYCSQGERKNDANEPDGA